MKSLLLVVCLIAIAGCLDEAPSPEPGQDATDRLSDSSPLTARYDLSAGIDQSWFLSVADPSGTTGVARITLTGPEGTPLRLDQLCFSYSYEVKVGNGTRTDQGTSGVCGGNTSISPNVSDQVLFELEGRSLLPGRYSFHAEGGPQFASLLVELVPR